MKRFAVLALMMILPAAALPVRAEMPYSAQESPADPYDYGMWLFIDGDADLPGTFDAESTWWLSDHRGSDPFVIYNVQEFYGVRGMGANKAWKISTGRPDVSIAILDSGVRWGRATDCNLLRKYFLNRGELPMPFAGPNPDDTVFGGYDVNGNGVFNIADYKDDPAVSDANNNGWLDPEDLILLFSDGVDGDDNGYVDDISGWDFFEGDNDPGDEVDFGHGANQAAHAAAEAALPGETCPEGPGYGFGKPPGTCPNCMILPLRVGDSFVADANHFAEAVAYAADNGASVVECALGTLNVTSFGQQAVDYAWERGVLVNASAADEASGHHNWPAAYERTLVHNSLRPPAAPDTIPYSYLYLNGCTNYGSYLHAAVPSLYCSSQAAGLASGLTGLLVSAAKNAVDRGRMTPYLKDDGTEASFPLSPAEMEQLWRLAADDVDFSTDYPDHEFSPLWSDYEPGWWPDDEPDGSQNGYGITFSIFPTRRYQTVRGWDSFTGYGRINAARLLRFIGLEGVPGVPGREFLPGCGPYAIGNDPDLTAQDRIPPEAEIRTPLWWRPYGYAGGFTALLPDDPADPGAIVVTGRAAANRVTAEGGAFDVVLEWAPGVQGAPAPEGTALASPGSAEKSAGPWTVVTHLTDRTEAVTGELGRISLEDIAAAQAVNPDPFSLEGDPTGIYAPDRYAVRIRLRVKAHPANEADDANNEAVQQKVVDVYPATESLLRLHLGREGAPCGGFASPSLHDLDGDGADELLLPTDDGLLHAYVNLESGEELPGWPAATLPLPCIPKDGDNAFTRGDLPGDVYAPVGFGTVAAADLDDDGRLEVLAGDAEGRLYAWEPDGSLRTGFPVTVDYALSTEAPCGPDTIPHCDDYGQRVRDPRNRRDRALLSAPSVGDIDPGTPGLEILAACSDGHVYAWHADGSPVEGWPVILRDPAKVAAMNETTRRVTYTPDSNWAAGTKALCTPSLGDLDGDGGLEVVASVNEEYEETPNAELDDLVQQLLDLGGRSGNTRVYALRAEGAASSGNGGTDATPHTQDQAYLPGWPVPVAAVVLDLLPTAGSGSDSSPALADLDGNATSEVCAVSHLGPVDVLRSDGQPFLGWEGGVHRTLKTGQSDFGDDTNCGDDPSFAAFCGLSLGALTPGGIPVLAAGSAGLDRMLDIVLPGRQIGAEDHLGLWTPADGNYVDWAPRQVNDLQFFGAPIFGDATGDGAAEVIRATAHGDLAVMNAQGQDLHHTGGWHMASPALGRVPLTGEAPSSLGLVSFTREGFLRVYPTQTPSGGDAARRALSQWPEAGHDAHNTHNLDADGERPYPPSNLAAIPMGSRVILRFTATGDDRDYGTASRYAARRTGGAVADPRWADAAPVAVSPHAPAQAGMEDAVTLSGFTPGTHTILLRAYDEAGNGSPPASIVVSVPGGGLPDPDPAPPKDR